MAAETEEVRGQPDAESVHTVTESERGKHGGVQSSLVNHTSRNNSEDVELPLCDFTAA